jgi:putative endonuclease
MHYLYILQSDKNKIYVGNTDDLKRRLVEHNSGQNYSTKEDKPFRIVYYEAYLNKQDALDREHKLKHHGSVIGHFKKRIKRSLAS